MKVSKQAKKEYDAKRYLLNRDKIIAQTKKWSSQNKKKRSAIVLKHAKKYPAKFAFISATRRACKKQRTPRWLTNNQKQEIRSYYILAQELQWLSEEKLHVDHIIPLQGKNVSGLHVPWNLQILPISLNCSKNNRLVA